MHWGLELLSHLIPIAHHLNGIGHSLENAINTTKKEIERSKQKNTLIANLVVGWS